jgi:hypothetical protein
MSRTASVDLSTLVTLYSRSANPLWNGQLSEMPTSASHKRLDSLSRHSKRDPQSLTRLGVFFNFLEPPMSTITIIATSARRRDPSTGNVTGHGRYLVSFQGEVIGTFRTPVCEAGRYLLEHRLATRADKLVMCRAENVPSTGEQSEGVPVLSGSVGWFADRSMEENEKVSPRWAKHRPMPAQLARTDAAGTLVGVDGDPS